MKHWNVIILVSCLLFIVSPIYSQSPASWEAYLYDINAQSIVVVRPTGSEPVFQIASDTTLEYAWLNHHIAISPDHRFVAVGSPGKHPVVVFHDIQQQTEFTTTIPTSDFSTLYQYVGAFSPDGTRFAFSYTGTSDEIYAGQLVIVDLIGTPGAVLQTITETEQPYFYPVSLDWRDEGIYYYPVAFGDAMPFGEMLLWNPITNVITQTERLHVDGYGDTLELTGEMVNISYNDSFAAEISPFPANIIEYRPQPLVSEIPTIAYHNPNHLSLPYPRWVLDGQAFLLYDQTLGSGWLVYRNGQILDISLPIDYEFLTGTPDGWLMFDPAGFGIYHYRFGANGLEFSQIATSQGPIILLERTPLGASVSSPFIPSPAIEAYRIRLKG
jgi:hypothetical protein